MIYFYIIWSVYDDYEFLDITIIRTKHKTKCRTFLFCPAAVIVVS